MSLVVKFWGVRGSLPASMLPTGWRTHIQALLKGFFSAGHSKASDVEKYMSSLDLPLVGGYGTGTTCVEVNSPKTRILIDGGSGIRNFSEKVMSGHAGSLKGPFHIFMTHFHWDHLMGLPFFSPHFVPNSEIHYYGVQKDLEEVIRSVFKKPCFPVSFESLPATIHFHTLEPRKTLKMADLEITPYQLDHPDPCWGYKVMHKKIAYAHCVDTESTRVSPEELGPDHPLYQGVDLMYFDAQYTFPELAEKANWGHSAAQIGLDLAFRENIKHVLFAHHDPGATIAQIQDLKAQTMEYFQWRLEHAAESGEAIPNIVWDFVHEGLEVRLG